MLYLLILLVLFIGSMHLLKTKVGLSSEDINVMLVGICGLGALEALAKIIVGLMSGAALGMLLAHLISGLISGLFAYYIFKKTGL